MGDGFYAERISCESGTYWAVKDEKTRRTVSVGDTIAQAVLAYETVLENEKAADALGVFPEDMEF